MSYLALYRKYRPSSFDQVRGQDHIVTTLRNQMNAGRIGHAYLFCGTRGTGKTSVAKLFAKAVNCENPIDGSPCGQCAMCRSIEDHTSMNVIEIDAASNNGVDNIRDIIDEVRYSPAQGRYKVYIIDEVHMLSGGAFNALLKTLEEPPSYVIFILATTEVHKIPVTILSRCQRYDFKRITVDTITDCLKGLMDSEGIEAEDRALRYVAKAADGSMRDAQSLLDQCIAFYLNRKLTYENVLEVLGAVDIEVFARLLRYIIKGSVDESMSLLDEIVLQGRELTQFVNDFAWYLRNLLIAQTTEDAASVLEFSAENMEMLLHEANVMPQELIIRYIRILSELSNRIRYASQKRLLVEVEIIKMCKPEMETDYSSLLNRVANIEQQLESGVYVQAGPEPANDSETAEEPALSAAVLEKAMTEDVRRIAESWRDVMARQGIVMRNALTTAKPTVTENGILKIVFKSSMDRTMMEESRYRGPLQRTLDELVGKAVTFEFDCAEDGKMNSVIDITKLVKTNIETTDNLN